MATGIKSSECSLVCEWQRKETAAFPFSTYLMCNIIRFRICYFLAAISCMVLNVITPCSWLLKPNIVLFAKKKILAIWIQRCGKFIHQILHVYIHGILTNFKLLKPLPAISIPHQSYSSRFPSTNLILIIMIPCWKEAACEKRLCQKHDILTLLSYLTQSLDVYITITSVAVAYHKTSNRTY